jgi:hypothetical protein
MGRPLLEFPKTYISIRLENAAIAELKKKYPGKTIQQILVECAYADIGYIPKNV